MSYKIEVRPDGRAYPILVCDHCGEIIVDSADGNTLWLEAAPGIALPRRYDPVHTHKECNLAYERAHPHAPGEHWMSNDVDHHLFMLLRNCRYDATEAKRKAEILSMLG